MTDLHTCSYYCNRPECIKAQRDELRERLAQPQRTHWEGCEEVHPECKQPEPVAHVTVAGALFDFMGWLTSRKKRLVLSSSAEASPAVEAIQEFAKMRGLSLADVDVQNWQQALAAPQRREWVGLTDEEIYKIDCLLITNITELVIAIETKLKHKNA